MTPAKLSLLAAALLAGFSVSVHAETMLSNFWRPYAYDIGVGNYPASTPYLAQSFQTGYTTQDFWRLDAVRLMMGDILGNPDGDFELSIYSSSSNLPGVKLATLIGPSRPDDDMAEQEFTGSLLLDPETQYWMVASSPAAQANGAYRWGGNDYTSFWIDDDGWGANPLHAIAISSNGSTWQNFSLSANGIGYLFFEIDATAVAAIPEPGAVTMLGAGLAAAWFFRGRYSNLHSFRNQIPRRSRRGGRPSSCS